MPAGPTRSGSGPGWSRRRSRRSRRRSPPRRPARSAPAPGSAAPAGPASRPGGMAGSTRARRRAEAGRPPLPGRERGAGQGLNPDDRSGDDAGQGPGDEHQGQPAAGLPLPPVPVQRSRCGDHVVKQALRAGISRRDSTRPGSRARPPGSCGRKDANTAQRQRCLRRSAGLQAEPPEVAVQHQCCHGWVGGLGGLNRRGRRRHSPRRRAPDGRRPPGRRLGPVVRRSIKSARPGIGGGRNCELAVLQAEHRVRHLEQCAVVGRDQGGDPLGLHDGAQQLHDLPTGLGV
jgi:hypothetical protein